MKGRVLVVDDEQDIRELLRTLLERAGYEVAEAADGGEALRQLYSTPPDAVILDVSMPKMDGWQTLERIREVSTVPVLMLTAASAELQRVRGLKGGADDYVGKPFGRQELLARVEALLRRARPEQAPRQSYRDDRVEIDFAQRRVDFEGAEVQLTPLEFKLLIAFVDHPLQVLSREQLLQLVWGSDVAVLPDQAKLYVSYLRRKLGGERSPIETVRGFGYRYRPD